MGNEVYYTNTLISLVKNILCSKLHRQIFFMWFPFHAGSDLVLFVAPIEKPEHPCLEVPHAVLLRPAFSETSARYRAVEPSSGSNVIPRRACPDLAGPSPYMLRHPLPSKHATP